MPDEPTLPSPVPPPAPRPVTPLAGPVMGILSSRKGVAMLGVLAFCAYVYTKDPSRLGEVMGLLKFVLPTWFAAHAWQEAKKAENGG
jgi:hypothetical protein